MNRLGEPLLVAEIQHFFGVEPLLNDKGVYRSESKEKRNYIIKNKLWYYLFKFGTALGDEVFYSTFIPFWFWNIDGAVGRRVVLVWALLMYIGQGIKDLVRWPRPGPPCIQLEKKWALEYGFPSTHAIVGVSIPFSVILYTMNRYEYNICLGIGVALMWSSIVCFSRLYLGMHSVLDIIAGVVLAVTLMIPLVPLIDYLDGYLLVSPTTPFLLVTLSILMIFYYPCTGKWTPTRGDTTMILSVSVGIISGAWLNYQTGLMTKSNLPIPHIIMWPSWTMFGYLLLRTLLGFLCVLATRQVVKSLSYSFICMLVKQDETKLKQSENTWQNRHKTFVELGCKYLTCGAIGFNMLYTLPQLFRFLKIERPTFFTEI